MVDILVFSYISTLITSKIYNVLKGSVMKATILCKYRLKPLNIVDKSKCYEYLNLTFKFKI